MEMSQSMKTNLRKLLVAHEDEKEFAYIDTMGNITAGIGHNLSANKISPEVIDKWFSDDVDYLYTSLSSDFPWFANLTEGRKLALIDMAFMGYQKFKGFQKMIDALSKGLYIVAATEVINSLYAKQVGKRAYQIHDILITGNLPKEYL